MSNGKITWGEVIQEYIEVFRYPGIFYEEPDGTELLIQGENDEGCFTLKDETPETVHDRIERSKKAGKNLFYEECPEYKIEYEPDAQY